MRNPAILLPFYYSLFRLDDLDPKKIYKIINIPSFFLIIRRAKPRQPLDCKGENPRGNRQKT